MRIRYTSPIAGHKAGDEVDIDHGSGEWLIDRGLAERVEESKSRTARRQSKRTKSDVATESDDAPGG